MREKSETTFHENNKFYNNYKQINKLQTNK